MDTEKNEAVVESAEGSAPVRSERPAQRPIRRRKKVCTFCAEKIDEIDYKDLLHLKKFVSERSKILPRRISGACGKHQRQLTVAVKRARYMALLPYTSD